MQNFIKPRSFFEKAQNNNSEPYRAISSTKNAVTPAQRHTSNNLRHTMPAKQLLRTSFWRITALTQIRFTPPACKERRTDALQMLRPYTASAPILAVLLARILLALLSDEPVRADALVFAVFPGASAAVQARLAMLASRAVVARFALTARHSGM